MPEDLKSQEYFIEPPFSYRPSIAEYLTKMEVTRDGFIADILHLDKKKNINIEKYEKDSLVLKLVSDKDLNDTEIFIWLYCLEHESNGIVTLRLKDISKKVIESRKLSTIGPYKDLVRKKVVEKFNSGFSPFYANTISQKLATSVMGLFILLFNMFLLLPFVFFGFLKSLQAQAEIRVFFNRFIWGYFKTAIKVYLMLFVVSCLSAMFVSQFQFESAHFNGDTGYGPFMTAVTCLVIFVWMFIKLSSSLTKSRYSSSEDWLVSPAILAGFCAIVVLVTGLLSGGNLGQAIYSVVWFFIIVLWFALLLYAGYLYGSVFIDYANWLFEKKEAGEHRKAWLKFSAFVHRYSELKDKPLKYYELWGEFYYYALAVGAIKNPKIV